jgi:cobaltochelatase CobN
MHLLVRETKSLDEAAPAVDLGQAAADIVMLSFSDADLGALAAAPRTGATVALASLAQLRHPLSVDLYLERSIAPARCVMAVRGGGSGRSVPVAGNPPGAAAGRWLG